MNARFGSCSTSTGSCPERASRCSKDLEGVPGLELWRFAIEVAPFTVIVDWEHTTGDHVPIRATTATSTSHMAVWPTSQHAALAKQAAADARASVRHPYGQRILLPRWREESAPTHRVEHRVVRR